MKSLSFWWLSKNLVSALLGAAIIVLVWMCVGVADLAPPQKLPPIDTELLESLSGFITWRNGMSEEEASNFRAGQIQKITISAEDEYRRIQEFAWDYCLLSFRGRPKDWRPSNVPPAPGDFPGPWYTDALPIYNDIAKHAYIGCAGELDKVAEVYDEPRFRDLLEKSERNKVLKWPIRVGLATIAALLCLIIFLWLLLQWTRGNLKTSCALLMPTKSNFACCLLGAGAIWTIWMQVRSPDMTPPSKLPPVKAELMRGLEKYVAGQIANYEVKKGLPQRDTGDKSDFRFSPLPTDENEYLLIAQSGWNRCMRNFRFLPEYWRPTDGEPPPIDLPGIYFFIEAEGYLPCVTQVDKLIDVYGEEKVRAIMGDADRIKFAKLRCGLALIAAAMVGIVASLCRSCWRRNQIRGATSSKP